MQEGDNLTKEQIEEEIKKIKEAHAEDEGNSSGQSRKWCSCLSFLHGVSSLLRYFPLAVLIYGFYIQ